MLVHDSIYDEVVDRVAAIAKALVVGDPWDPNSVSGPVISDASLKRILGMIDRALEDGSRLVTGGNRLGGELADGFFLEPTVFADVDPASELAQEEVFGPVLAISKFSTVAEAISIANGTRYGLSGYIQTRDVRRALAIAEEMETGEVLINGSRPANPGHPFGGIGASGLGKEGGRFGVEEFLRVKGIALT